MASDKMIKKEGKQEKQWLIQPFDYPVGISNNKRVQPIPALQGGRLNSDDAVRVLQRLAYSAADLPRTIDKAVKEDTIDALAGELIKAATQALMHPPDFTANGTGFATIIAQARARNKTSTQGQKQAEELITRLEQTHAAITKVRPTGLFGMGKGQSYTDAWRQAVTQHKEAKAAPVARQSTAPPSPGRTSGSDARSSLSASAASAPPVEIEIPSPPPSPRSSLSGPSASPRSSVSSAPPTPPPVAVHTKEEAYSVLESSLHKEGVTYDEVGIAALALTERSDLTQVEKNDLEVLSSSSGSEKIPKGELEEMLEDFAKMRAQPAAVPIPAPAHHEARSEGDILSELKTHPHPPTDKQIYVKPDYKGPKPEELFKQDGFDITYTVSDVARKMRTEILGRFRRGETTAPSNMIKMDLERFSAALANRGIAPGTPIQSRIADLMTIPQNEEAYLSHIQPRIDEIKKACDEHPFQNDASEAHAESEQAAKTQREAGQAVNLFDKTDNFSPQDNVGSVISKTTTMIKQRKSQDVILGAITELACALQNRGLEQEASALHDLRSTWDGRKSTSGTLSAEERTQINSAINSICTRGFQASIRSYTAEESAILSHHQYIEPKANSVQGWINQAAATKEVRSEGQAYTARYDVAEHTDMLHRGGKEKDEDEGENSGWGEGPK